MCVCINTLNKLNTITEILLHASFSELRFATLVTVLLFVVTICVIVDCTPSVDSSSIDSFGNLIVASCVD